MPYFLKLVPMKYKTSDTFHIEIQYMNSKLVEM